MASLRFEFINFRDLPQEHNARERDFWIRIREEIIIKWTKYPLTEVKFHPKYKSMLDNDFKNIFNLKRVFEKILRVWQNLINVFKKFKNHL